MMKKQLYFLLFSLLIACSGSQQEAPSVAVYHPAAIPGQVATGGVQMIPIATPSGDFKVWTKRVGNNPRIKVLLLHGGPGGTHEYFESFDSFLPHEGIEYIYYDQLGSHRSDQPDDSTLWVTERFVEEVEQVRLALGLNADNFYLLGHSWGGILAIEYALKYQENLKGLIISNMMASCPAYGKYAEEVLGPQMDPEVLAKVRAFEANNQFDHPEYMDLLMKHHYVEHILRMPLEDWPEPVNRMFAHLNPAVYVPMQGPSEFGIRGTLEKWDRTADLPKITVPTLTIGATYDSMDPKHMEWMSTQLPKGRFLLCPNGSHIAMFDDQQVYFDGLIRFLRDVDAGER